MVGLASVLIGASLIWQVRKFKTDDFGKPLDESRVRQCYLYAVILWLLGIADFILAPQGGWVLLVIRLTAAAATMLGGSKAPKQLAQLICYLCGILLIARAVLGFMGK